MHPDLEHCERSITPTDLLRCEFCGRQKRIVPFGGMRCTPECDDKLRRKLYPLAFSDETEEGGE